MDARQNGVCSVTLIPAPRLAQPKPSSQIIRPRCATATATPVALCDPTAATTASRTPRKSWTPDRLPDRVRLRAGAVTQSEPVNKPFKNARRVEPAPLRFSFSLRLSALRSYPRIRRRRANILERFQESEGRETRLEAESRERGIDAVMTGRERSLSPNTASVLSHNRLLFYTSQPLISDPAIRAFARILSVLSATLPESSCIVR